MNALQNWHEIIHHYRAETMKNNHYWQGSHAAWYDTWVKQNDYSLQVYPYFQPYIHGHVLEIGAGTGLFTKHLLHDAETITVLDPSADMLTYLVKNIPQSPRLQLSVCKVEDFQPQVPGYTFILAVHALFNVLEIDDVLQRLCSLSPYIGIVIGSGEGLALHTLIHEHFKTPQSIGRPPCHKDLIPVLDELQIPYQWQIVESETYHTYPTQAELLQAVSTTCHISEDQQAELTDFISPYLQQTPSGWSYSGVRQHVCVLLSPNQ